MPILSIRASQRLDSRGKPTVQVDLTTSHGTFRSIVPSGASKGDYEAVELRDGDASAFQGNGVLKACQNVDDVLGPRIIESNLDPAHDLKKIDELMIKLDGTDDESKLGANAILGISMAAARAGAAARGIELYEFLAGECGSSQSDYVMPVPFMNVLNGGDHSGNPMAFQEFMIAPVGASSLVQAVQWNAEIEINQIGTVTEAIAAGQEAYSTGWSVFVSHRSGETTDDFIADLTVGMRTGHLKSGAPARGERVAKYNRLMDIEDKLRYRGEKFAYAGENLRFAHR